MVGTSALNLLLINNTELYQNEVRSHGNEDNDGDITVSRGTLIQEKPYGRNDPGSTWTYGTYVDYISCSLVGCLVLPQVANNTCDTRPM